VCAAGTDSDKTVWPWECYILQDSASMSQSNINVNYRELNCMIPRIMKG